MFTRYSINFAKIFLLYFLLYPSALCRKYLLHIVLSFLIFSFFLCGRYEVVAAAKLLGGVTFQYTVRGDKSEANQGLKVISGDAQRSAINMV